MYVPVKIHTYIPLTLYPRRDTKISNIPSRRPRFTKYLAMSYTADRVDVTGGKPIAV
jgi:hypothetical protein